jgi:hypothetical protein
MAARKNHLWVGIALRHTRALTCRQALAFETINYLRLYSVYLLLCAIGAIAHNALTIRNGGMTISALPKSIAAQGMSK